MVCGSRIAVLRWIDKLNGQDLTHIISLTFVLSIQFINYILLKFCLT